jgi:K+-transporting ATPase ATPase B chain
VAADSLRTGDLVVVEAGELVPGDGEVIEGVASVDESAITGESAPVIRESGGDRSAVTGGTRVLSDRIVVKITVRSGQTFLDRMIALVEGASRQKTPNEIALHILLVGMTIVFLLACVTLVPLAAYSSIRAVGHRHRRAAGVPDSHHHRRVAVRHRHRRHGSPDSQERHRHERPRHRGGRRRRHLAARQDRHHHLGNRMATEFIPVGGSTVDALADAAQLASLADETPEGRSIVVLAKEKFKLRGRDVEQLGAQFVKFSALTRMSGCDLDGRKIRKGAVDAIKSWVESMGGEVPRALEESRRRSPIKAPRRWRWPKARTCSGSCA